MAPDRPLFEAGVSSLRECKCPLPNPKGSTKNNPNWDHVCVKCSGYINPAWRTCTESFEEFFQRLAEGMFHATVLYGSPETRAANIKPLGPPQWFLDFKEQCRARYEAGQSRFDYTPFTYLTRDNAAEGQSEATDACNYSWFEILRQRRDGEPEEWALALTAAKLAAELHQTLAALGAHRHKGISPS